MTQTTLTRTAPVNPDLRHIAPESLLIAADDALWVGLQRIAQLYGRNLPKGVDQGTAMLLMLAGKEYGLGPVQAISDLFFIGGRIVPSANTMMRLAAGNGLVIRPLRATDEVWEAEFTRPGRESITMEYTIEMARKAGLLGSDTWKKHPQFMLRARCVSAGIRLYAGDLVRGMEYTAEEMTNGHGYFDAEGNFTPDDTVVGGEPAADFVPFEGIQPEGQSGAKSSKAKPRVKTLTPAKEPQPAPTAEAAAPTPEAAAPAEPRESHFAIDVMPHGDFISLATKANGIDVDFAGTMQNIFAALTKALNGDSDAARAQAKKLLTKVGVESAEELRGQPSFIAFYQHSNQFCRDAAKKAQAAAEKAALEAAKNKKAADEAPAFDPKRGARTASPVAVADAEEGGENLDERILTLFTLMAEAERDEEANAIMADTGYEDEGEAAPTATKLETLRLLQEAHAKSA